MFSTDTLAGGFTSPVFEAQGMFRKLMDGFSRPGNTASVETQVQPPLPFGKAAASVLLALCDFETNAWLSKSLRHPDLRKWVAFHTGAPICLTETEAAFAFAASIDELPPLGSFCQGTDEYPDISSTIILEIASLEGGRSLALAGPGINGSAAFSPQGLPSGFLEDWERNGALFPCGVDLILTAGDRFLCLPRTTRILEA